MKEKEKTLDTLIEELTTEMGQYIYDTDNREDMLPTMLFSIAKVLLRTRGERNVIRVLNKVINEIEGQK